MSTIDGKFFTRLAEERKRLKLSQDAIADICGISRKQWGNYEAGRNVPNAEVLFSLIARGADILYLMTGERTGSVKNISHDGNSYNQEEVGELLDVFAHTSEDGRHALLAMARALKSVKSL